MDNLAQIYYSSIFKIVDVVTKIQSIRVKDITEMFFATNSRKIYSNNITETSYTEFSDIMLRKITKLKKKNKEFICKQPVVTFLCKINITQKYKIIIYNTSNNYLNLNGEVKALTQEPSYCDERKIIVCRHLSYVYATKKLKLNEIDSKEKLQQHIFFQKDYIYYYYQYFPAEGYYFQSIYLGKALQDIAKNLLLLNIKGYKSYMLCTVFHAMALRIKFNNNYWKIRFYDPNLTVNEKIIIIENIDDIAFLSLDDLIDKVIQSFYLNRRDALCLVSTETHKTQLKCKTYLYGDTNKLEILKNKIGHYYPVNGVNTSQVSELTLALVNNQSNEVFRILSNLKEFNLIYLNALTPNIQAMPAFNLCLVKGLIASLKVYLSFILNSEIDINNKHFLVGSMVHLSIKFNQIAATVVYTKTILKTSKLSTEDKFNFINSNLLLELPYLNTPNENKALSAFIKIIQQSDFSLSQQKKLLPDNYI